MRLIVVSTIMFLVIACSTTRDVASEKQQSIVNTTIRGEQQDMGAENWLMYSDAMDADYAMQIMVHIKALEHQNQQLRDALDTAVDQRDFWFNAFEECARNNYAEALGEQDYQLELILRPDEDEICHDCEEY